MRAYYFSSSGGQTENSEDIWVATLSYTRSVTDPYSVSNAAGNPYKTWGKTISQSNREIGVRAFRRGKASRSSSAPPASSTAAVTILEATSSTGETSRITGAEHIRITFGLKSAWIGSITGNG